MASEMIIGERITAALENIVDLYLDVAETDTTPYAVYSLEFETVTTKDGPYKYVVSVDFAVVASNAAERDSLHAACHAGIMGLQSSDIRVQHSGTQPISDGNIEFAAASKYVITQLIINN